ncbi:MAG: hypothetical protein ABSG67_08625, partial [Thermoguttaceae bacterium]
IARHNRTDGAGGNPLQLITAPVGAPLSAGDALQPLSAVTDDAITQPATASADIADSLPITLPAADVATSQPAPLLEDKNISQPVYAAVEITITQAEMSSAAAEIAEASAIVTPVQSPFTLFPHPSMAVQFPGILYSQDMARNTILFCTSFNAGASDKWLPTPERGNQMFMLGRGNRTSHPASSQDILHDAVFARSIARFSLTEEDGLPDDSIVPADVEVFLDDCLPAKSCKSFAHAIDAFFDALRHNKG